MTKETEGAAGAIWLLAPFRSVYRGRVEITERDVEVVPLPDALGGEMLGSDAGDGQELHLAGSHDGLHWTPLNGNRPVWPGRFVRDPFINHDPSNGFFHLVATGRQIARSCLYDRSRDLLTWEERSLPLMEAFRDAAGRQVNNVWAPEWFYSSSFANAGWKESCLWSSRTAELGGYGAGGVVRVRCLLASGVLPKHSFQEREADSPFWQQRVPLHKRPQRINSS